MMRSIVKHGIMELWIADIITHANDLCSVYPSTIFYVKMPYRLKSLALKLFHEEFFGSDC